jgi:hypothetical protein
MEEREEQEDREGAVCVFLTQLLFGALKLALPC